MRVQFLQVQVITGEGADKLIIETNLPNGEWPFKGHAHLQMSTARGSGLAYAKRYFPEVELVMIKR